MRTNVEHSVYLAIEANSSIAKPWAAARHFHPQIGIAKSLVDVGCRAREAGGEISVTRAQDVDTKHAILAHCGVAAACPINANQERRRVVRDTAYRRHGEAM